jgi:hypothetical protein
MEATQALRGRIAELEAENRMLRGEASTSGAAPTQEAPRI